MKTCKYCGKEYILNSDIPDFLPEKIKELMKYKPACDCLEKKLKSEYEQQERELEKERALNRIKKYRDISIIDTKLLKSNFSVADMSDKHIQFCKKYAERFVKIGKAPKGMMLYGTVGTGKTYASACMANYLMEHNKTVLFMNLGLYIIKLKREWEDAENDILNYVKSCDLLVIDDLGVENVTDWVRDKVFTLIDTRYRAEKPLIITTNLKLRGKELSIESKFGVRIADRIEEMCYPVQISGISKRVRNKGEFLEFMA